MATDTSKITGAADDLSDKLTKGGSAAKTLGAEIANAFNTLDARVAALEAGATTPPVEPPIEPPPTNTYGRIENFTAANGGAYKIDTLDCANDSPGKAWNLTKLDDYALRFEIRSGDVWSQSGGGYQDSGCNRCEVSFWQRYNEGVMMNWEGTVTVLPGPVNTGSFFCLVQSHATTNVSPTWCPFSFGIDKNGTDKLLIVLSEPKQQYNNIVYTSPNAIVRGQPMRLKAKVKMGPTGNGYVGCWWDDKQIVNFNGKVGATNSQYWWKYGIYRDEAPEVAKVDFKNVHITMG